jgi:hypothetical protein
LYEEKESELPEWEIPEEKVPKGLHDKWKQDEQRGLKAGLCPNCKWPFTEQDLRCQHCGQPCEVESGVMSSLAHFFTKTPWGVVTVLTIIFAFIAIML